jgi:hypothetical protein
MVSIASVAEREESLRRVVACLLPQADRLNVYLNGYSAVPPFLDHPRIVTARSQQHGDAGDAGKFYWLEAGAQYYLACDDDIVYPPDYVARTIGGIERYRRRAVVGWHGSILLEHFAEYYRDRRILSFYAALESDTPVHVLGTGTVGFHSSTLRLAFADFEIPNMADVWFAIKGQQQRVPFVVLAHRAGELLPIEQEAGDRAIWRDCVEDAASRRNTRSMQNRMVLEHCPWTIYEAPRPSRAARAAPVALAFLLAAVLLAAGAFAWAGGYVMPALGVAGVAALVFWVRSVWLRWTGRGRV